MRGTPGGETPVSKAATEEFRQNFDQNFTRPVERRPGRTRYVFDEEAQKLVEVSADWQPSDRRLPVVGDSHYDGQRAPDGTDVSSRTKFKNYLKATGYTTADDYTQTWAKRAEERAQPVRRDPTRRDAIGRAVYEHLEKGGRR